MNPPPQKSSLCKINAKTSKLTEKKPFLIAPNRLKGDDTRFTGSLTA